MAEEIAKKEGTALAVSSDALLEFAGKGTENIGIDDVRPPRLMICQSGTPQRKPGDPKQIKGLNEMDMFNDLTNEIYGQGPLKIVVVKMMGTRFMEFAPMDEGGGVIDFNVPANDPRTQGRTVDGVWQKPVATQFYDYLLWLPDHQELVAWSLKSSQLKLARNLNGQLKVPLRINGITYPSPPAFARMFELTGVMVNKDSFAWASYKITPIPGVTPADIFAACAAQYKAFEGVRVDVAVEHPEQEGVPAGDVPF